MQLRRVMTLGLAMAAMVAVIPVATRGQTPASIPHLDHASEELVAAKLEN